MKIPHHLHDISGIILLISDGILFNWEKSVRVFIRRRYKCVKNFFCHSSYQIGIFHPDLCHINKLKTISQLWLHAHWLISRCSLTWILLGILSCLTVQWNYFSSVSQKIHKLDTLCFKASPFSAFIYFTDIRKVFKLRLAHHLSDFTIREDIWLISINVTH